MMRCFILLVLYLCTYSSSTILPVEELSDLQFTLVEGWELQRNSEETFNAFSDVSICDSLSLLGGLNSLGDKSILRRIFSNLPEHAELQITFEVYFIDNFSISDALTVSLDDYIVQPEISSDSPVSQLCGNTQPEKIWKFSATFPHSNSELTLLITDTFTELVSSASWGIRNFTLSDNNICDETCAECSLSICIKCLSGNDPIEGQCSSTETTPVPTTIPIDSPLPSIPSITTCGFSINSLASSLLFIKNSVVSIDPLTNTQIVSLSIVAYFDQTTSISDICKQQFTSSLNYFSEANASFVQFPATYITPQSSGSLNSVFPIVYLESLAQNVSNGSSSISNGGGIDQSRISSAISFGLVLKDSKGNSLKEEIFDMILVEEGGNLQVYLFDKSVKNTAISECEQDCSNTETVIIPQVRVEICEDSTCKFSELNTVTDDSQANSSSENANNDLLVRVVGESVISKFTFKDSNSQTKLLTLKQVLLKINNDVYDISNFAFVLNSTTTGEITVQVMLNTPGENIVIQFNLQSAQQSSSRSRNIRRLISEGDSTTSISSSYTRQLKLTVVGVDKDEISSETSSEILSLNIHFLVSLIFILSMYLSF